MYRKVTHPQHHGLVKVQKTHFQVPGNIPKQFCTPGWLAEAPIALRTKIQNVAFHRFVDSGFGSILADRWPILAQWNTHNRWHRVVRITNRALDGIPHSSTMHRDYLGRILRSESTSDRIRTPHFNTWIFFGSDFPKCGSSSTKMSWEGRKNQNYQNSCSGVL